MLMAFGVVSLIARFVLGLGGSTHLSDTYAWGLWIVFDLVWIAVAAGAFATAGIIYVFQRKDLYSMGRSAVLMGLLSYSFVTVTLIADLGLPWHFYQLALQAPEHSAMFEVSWCVGLYVTYPAAGVSARPFERWDLQQSAGHLAALVRRLRCVRTDVVRLSAFARADVCGVAAAVYSRFSPGYSEQEARRSEPIMLAIAAVTLSTMHQSSLGSLFLLMPDKAGSAMVVSGDAGRFFLSVDRGRDRPRDPGRDVDRESMEAAAPNKHLQPWARSLSGRFWSIWSFGSAIWRCADNSPTRSPEGWVHFSQSRYFLAASFRLHCSPARQSDFIRRYSSQVHSSLRQV